MSEREPSFTNKAERDKEKRNIILALLGSCNAKNKERLGVYPLRVEQINYFKETPNGKVITHLGLSVECLTPREDLRLGDDVRVLICKKYGFNLRDGLMKPGTLISRLTTEIPSVRMPLMEGNETYYEPVSPREAVYLMASAATRGMFLLNQNPKQPNVFGIKII